MHCTTLSLTDNIAAFDYKAKRISNSGAAQSPYSRGATLLELLVVVAIVCILVAILFPAIQATRENSRQLICGARLSRITRAAHQFETARHFLPPGILGNAIAFQFEGNRYEPSSQFYWKNYQYTSSLALILPFMELQGLADSCDPVFFNVDQTLLTKRKTNPVIANYSWFGDLDGFEIAAEQQLVELRCPSDSIGTESVTHVMGALQPVVFTREHIDRISWQNLLTHAPLQYSFTNYAGCTGVHSGGELDAPMHRRFRGLMTSRFKMRWSKNTDGQSRTIIYGETLGSIRDGKRSAVQSWFVGAIARGRGPLPWPDAFSEASPLGDSRAAFHFGFASVHPNSVTFTMADGHVEHISRHTDRSAFYAFCGIADGGQSH